LAGRGTPVARAAVVSGSRPISYSFRHRGSGARRVQLLALDALDSALVRFEALRPASAP